MKILKIFGLVVGIHIFALILIFANPGCSSTSKTPPAPEQTAAKTDTPPPVSAPVTPPASAASGSIYSSRTDSSTLTPITFNPDAPAGTLPVGGGGSRIAPTRPGTPVAGVLAAEPVADVTPTSTYTVKSGDSLSAIAKKHGITTAALQTANNLSSKAVLKPGQKLLIPAKPPVTSVGSTPAVKLPDASVAKSAAGDTVKHTVKSGETLGGIARKYGVKQGDLAEANSISDPAKIRPGMELIIPGWNTPAGKKSGKSAPAAAAKAPAASSTPTIETPAATPPATTPVITPAPVPVIKIEDPAPKQP